jgi:hypothetical protein
MLLAEDLIAGGGLAAIAGASEEIVEAFRDLDLTIDLIILIHGNLCQAAAGARSYRLQLPNFAQRNDCQLGIIGRYVRCFRAVQHSGATASSNTISKGRPKSWCPLELRQGLPAL